MQLSTYIKDLLYRYECVIIPGFGAFLTQNESARIDTETETFYPPGKSVSFNRQLQTNDGILANYVAAVESCPYEIALQKIRNFTGTLSLQLSEGKTITLKNVGEFSLNSENSVQFVPANKENFSRNSFGLSAFTSPTIDRSAVDISEEKEVVRILESKRKSSVPILKYAAIGLIAITLGGFSGLKIYEGEVEKFNYAEKQKADVLVENQIQEATFVIENPLPALNFTIPKQSGKYHIVAGAFRIENNAHKKIKQLAEKGYSAQLIGVNRYGLHQVVYSSHEDRLDALQTLRTIKRSENKDAWLLVQDLNK
ncbi:MAG: HU-CCDC81 and SPOR domain-containing protein [Flavobacteriaceae bacterium]|nr:HU-CCDC81 and SPOR domain-containing protein [Flavobacteriaceae bacterium]